MIIRATIEYEYNTEDDPEVNGNIFTDDMEDWEKVEAVKTAITEEIMNLGFDSYNDLYEGIQIETIN